ncbi:MAG: insulinase family protein, partial [Chlorobiaceae bacterium]|nr:insulinase family protein [Chlorobiaceae bacterium]
MKVRVLILLLVIFPFAGIVAQQGNIKFTEYDLPNGLHVILHQDNTTPIVAVSILYHVGSKNEVAGRTGFAHFFEHLMFEGSDNIPRGEYDKITLSAGGTLNANTSQDRTFYYEILPSNQLELGLWLESERLLHLRIDSTGVETQRAVVKEERKESQDNRPYGSVIEKTMENAYKIHPYKWTPIGYPEDLSKATLQEFMEFHSIYYVPNNATLSIAGDLDIESTKKMIEKYFGDIPKGTKEIYRPSIVEPEKTAEVIDTVYDNIQLPAVIMSYHMPAQ